MKKINIIKKNAEFENIINIKKNYRNFYFNIFIKKNNLNISRFGIAVPKKIGNAVVRNKIKRQIKDIIDKNELNILPSMDYVIIMRKEILDSNYQKIREKLISIMTEIN